MASWLSNLANNFDDGIHKVKYTNFNMCCIEYTIAEDAVIEYKCFQ